MSFLPKVCLVAVASLFLQDSEAARIKEIKKELRAQGIRIASSYAALTAESELKSDLRKVRSLRTSMMKTDKELEGCKKLVQQNRNAMNQLTATNVDLNARLAKVTPGDVATNNKLVGLINSNNSRLKLLDEQRKKINETLRRVRHSANQSRENYVSHILEMRALVNRVRDEYESTREKDEPQSLLSELSKLAGRTYKLEPSRSFESSVRQLAKIEQTVLSQTIRLRREEDTFYVSVVVNGKAREMVLDSGSTHIGLPWGVAKELGVKIKPSDKAIRLQLADGRQISGTLVTLANVRIGGFVVNNVEAAVLGPEAKAAQPLLGMSYLKHFKFEIKPAEATLALVRPERKGPRTANNEGK